MVLDDSEIGAAPEPQPILREHGKRITIADLPRNLQDLPLWAQHQLVGYARYYDTQRLWLSGEEFLQPEQHQRLAYWDKWLSGVLVEHS